MVSQENGEPGLCFESTIFAWQRKYQAVRLQGFVTRSRVRISAGRPHLGNVFFFFLDLKTRVRKEGRKTFKMAAPTLCHAHVRLVFFYFIERRPIGVSLVCVTPVFIRETIALIGQRDQRSQRETRLAMIGGGQHACLTTVTLGHCECQGAWLLMVAILTAATVEGEQKSIYENDANAVLHSVR